MTIYEAASFYGDYRMLLAEIAEEPSCEKVEATDTHESFFNDNSSTIEIFNLNSQPV